MHQLYLESTLDRLLRTEEGLVKKHALKVLWVLRDHDQAVKSAQAAVAELDRVRAIADRYQLSGLDPLQARAGASSKLTLRLRNSMTERNLPAKLLASLQWCSESGLMPGLGCASQGLQQEDERKEAGRRVKLGASAPAGNTVKRYETDIKELRLAVMQLQIKLQDSTREHSSVKKLMDNLRMITLSLDRDFDAWKPEDSQSLADTVAESAGVAKEHVKILDCQRGSVIASTVILAPDWVAVAEKLKTSLMDESGSLKDMGVVGCSGLMGGVVGKTEPRGSVATAGLVEKNTRLVERVVARWTRHDVSATLNAWRDHARKQQRATTVCARVVSHWLHRCTANAFESWHIHAKEQRHMEDLCSKIVRHMLNLQVCSMPLHSDVVCCHVIVACSDGLFDDDVLFIGSFDGRSWQRPSKRGGITPRGRPGARASASAC